MTKKRKTNSVTNLKSALIDLLLEMEYSKITIGNITQRANVSRGTFYQHFLDKDDLAYSIGTETMQRFWEILAQGNLDKEDMLLKALLLIKNDYKHFKAISKAPHVQFKDKVQHFLKWVEKEPSSTAQSNCIDSLAQLEKMTGITPKYDPFGEVYLSLRNFCSEVEEIKYADFVSYDDILNLIKEENILAKYSWVKKRWQSGYLLLLMRDFVDYAGEENDYWAVYWFHHCL